MTTIRRNKLKRKKCKCPRCEKEHYKYIYWSDKCKVIRKYCKRCYHYMKHHYNCVYEI